MMILVDGSCSKCWVQVQMVHVNQWDCITGCSKLMLFVCLLGAWRIGVPSSSESSSQELSRVVVHDRHTRKPTYIKRENEFCVV